MYSIQYIIHTTTIVTKKWYLFKTLILNKLKLNNQLEPIYYVDEYLYDASSINAAEELLLRCHHLIGKDSHFWVSFQSNSLVDFTSGPLHEDFSSTFKKMKEHLANEGFHIATLSANTRNSKQIGQLAQEVIDSNDRFPVNDAISISTVKTVTVNSIAPTLIPVHFNDKKKCLISAMLYALKLITKIVGNSKSVILHDDLFNSKDIKNDLMSANEENKDNIYIYPKYETENSTENGEEDFDKFIVNPKGVLITDEKFYVGMETQNVVYLTRCIYSSVRCSFMRAVSNLVVIHLIEYVANFTFGDASLDPHFLTCEENMKTNAYQCETCKKYKVKEIQTGDDDDENCDPKLLGQSINNELMVCKSCSVGCHQGHSLKKLNLKRDLKCDLKSECLCHKLTTKEQKEMRLRELWKGLSSNHHVKCCCNLSGNCKIEK